MSSNNKTQDLLANEITGLYRAVMALPRVRVDDLERFPRVSRVLEHEVRGLLSVRVALTSEEGDGYWELTRVRNDVVILLSRVFSQHPRVHSLPKDGRVQFDFKLTGELRYRVSGPEAPEDSSHSALHVWRQPRVGNRSAPMNSEQRSLAISVRPEFLLEHLLPARRELPSALQAVVSTPERGSADCHLQLTKPMLAITTQLFENRYQGTLSLTYVEALSLELLCFAVANFWSLPDRPKRTVHRARVAGLEHGA